MLPVQQSHHFLKKKLDFAANFEKCFKQLNSHLHHFPDRFRCQSIYQNKVICTKIPFDEFPCLKSDMSEKFLEQKKKFIFSHLHYREKYVLHIFHKESKGIRMITISLLFLNFH